MLELMLSFVGAGSLVTMAATLLERGLAHLRAGTRFAWTFALLATALVPFLPQFSSRTVDVVPVLEMPTLVVNATSAAGSRVPVNVLLIVWLVLSAAVLSAYATAYVRLWRAKRSWQPARIAQNDVFMSDGFGPAVFGFITPRIVVPRWIRDASVHDQALIVLHEREHIRAGDQLQLLLAIVSTVLMPWNPFTWWQSRRLRFTIEADCDQRVLAAAPDRARYASLLVNVGGRQAGLLLTPALAEHKNGLEARVNMLTHKLIRNRWKAAGLLVAGAVLAFAACESRMPQDPEQTAQARVQDDYIKSNDNISDEAAPTQFRKRGQVPARVVADTTSLPRKVDPDGEPHVTPYTKMPQLSNRQEVSSLLASHYPPLLRHAGIAGRTIGWALVDERGRVLNTRVKESSGHAALDSAALKVLRRMEFVPAEHQGMRVPVWIALPIKFEL